MHKSVMEELKRLIEDSEVMQEDDALWPAPDRVGRQVSVDSITISTITINLFSDWLNNSMGATVPAGGRKPFKKK